MTERLAVVLAAGKGTRMKSERPKVLIPVAGRPMIEWVLDVVADCGVDQSVVVVGYKADEVEAALADREGITFVRQTEQLGTGHAVMVCREVLERHDGPVLVVTGDSPLMQRESIRALLEAFDERQPACLLGTARKEDPTGLGRIVRDAQGEFAGIVEQRDATEEQRRITEVNMSCYVFDCRELLFALERIGRGNAQGEYYLTDCPGVLKAAGRRVEALPVLKPVESLSINTLEDLAAVEAVLQAE